MSQAPADLHTHVNNSRLNLNGSDLSGVSSLLQMRSIDANRSRTRLQETATMNRTLDENDLKSIQRESIAKSSLMIHKGRIIN